MARIVALLESMWGWRGYHTAGQEAPRYFRINPENFTGKRLYRICGTGHKLLVTDSCREIQKSAKHHGTPDPTWVRENLEFLDSQGMDLLLVCGKIAQATFERVASIPSGSTEGRVGLISCPYLYMDHPAARRWSNATLDAKTAYIAKLLSQNSHGA